MGQNHVSPWGHCSHPLEKGRDKSVAGQCRMGGSTQEQADASYPGREFPRNAQQDTDPAAPTACQRVHSWLLPQALLPDHYQLSAGIPTGWRGTNSTPWRQRELMTLCSALQEVRAPHEAPQMEGQESSVPHTSHRQTAHPTAVIHSHSLTWKV